jgi:hypothetical protein
MTTKTQDDDRELRMTSKNKEQLKALGDEFFNRFLERSKPELPDQKA